MDLVDDDEAHLSDIPRACCGAPCPSTSNVPPNVFNYKNDRWGFPKSTGPNMGTLMMSIISWYSVRSILRPLVYGSPQMSKAPMRSSKYGLELESIAVDVVVYSPVR